MTLDDLNKEISVVKEKMRLASIKLREARNLAAEADSEMEALIKEQFAIISKYEASLTKA